MADPDLFDGGEPDPRPDDDPLRAVRLAARAEIEALTADAAERRDAMRADHEAELSLMRSAEVAEKPGERAAVLAQLAAHRLSMWGPSYQTLLGAGCVYCGSAEFDQGADWVPPLALASWSAFTGPFVRYPACSVCERALRACPDVCLQHRAGVMADFHGGYDATLTDVIRARMRTGAFFAVCRCDVCTSGRAAKAIRDKR